MKNFILILITLTTIYAQTSAVDLYEQSQKALSSGDIELAGEKLELLLKQINLTIHSGKSLIG